jgi:hypothetical protein
MIGAPCEITKQSRLGHFLDYAPEGSIYWNFDTFGQPINTKWNKGCYDVSKEKVQNCMFAAFGYSQKVNPISYRLPYVDKSNLQAKHDGFIRAKPVTPKPNRVYEMMLDTKKGNYYLEHRVFVFNEARFVIEKKKPVNDRFGWKSEETKYYEVTDVFTPVQIECINRFCECFDVQLCELDVMITDRPYIIDVNNMAGGTDDFGIFRICNNKDFEWLYNRYADCLSNMY